MARSRRYKEATKLVGDPLEKHSLEGAVSLLQTLPKVKFDETVELSFHLGLDPKQSNQMVRGTINLPHGSGQKVRVIVFTENPQEALDAGAMEAGMDELLEKVTGGWIDFDVAIATTSAMKQVRKIARVLGPRGLMPNPKSGTVTDDIPSGVKAVLAGRVEFKMDKTANLAIVIGKASFSSDQLKENAKEAISVLANSRPDGAKGTYVKRGKISSSMGPSVTLNLKEFSNL